MSENDPISPPEGWVVYNGDNNKWVSTLVSLDGKAQVISQGEKYYAEVATPLVATREQADKLRLAMVQALVASNHAPPELIAAEQTALHNFCDRIGAPGGQPLSQRLGWAAEALSAQLKAVDAARGPTPPPPLALAISMALDEVKAPANESLVERIRGLGAELWDVRNVLNRARAPLGESLAERVQKLSAQAKEANGHWCDLLEGVRQALNVGPPSDSDVKPDASAKRLVEIVRARSVLMLEEREQRVALAKEMQRLEKQLMDERNRAVQRLEGWMSGEMSTVRRALEEQVVRLTYDQGAQPEDAIDALRNRRALAALVLTVDFADTDIPF